MFALKKVSAQITYLFNVFYFSSIELTIFRILSILFHNTYEIKEKLIKISLELDGAVQIVIFESPHVV